MNGSNRVYSKPYTVHLVSGLVEQLSKTCVNLLSLFDNLFVCFPVIRGSRTFFLQLEQRSIASAYLFNLLHQIHSRLFVPGWPFAHSDGVKSETSLTFLWFSFCADHVSALLKHCFVPRKLLFPYVLLCETQF